MDTPRDFILFASSDGCVRRHRKIDFVIWVGDCQTLCWHQQVAVQRQASHQFVSTGSCWHRYGQRYIPVVVVECQVFSQYIAGVPSNFSTELTR